MNTTNPNPGPERAGARVGRLFARLALMTGAACAVAALLPGPAYRMQWVSLATGFSVLRGATYGAIGAAVAAGLALLVLLLMRAPKGRATAVTALVLGLVVAAPGVHLSRQAQQLPKIHDQFHRYYEPLRHPKAAGLSVAGVRLVVPERRPISARLRRPSSCLHAAQTTARRRYRLAHRACVDNFTRT